MTLFSLIFPLILTGQTPMPQTDKYVEFSKDFFLNSMDRDQDLKKYLGEKIILLKGHELLKPEYGIADTRSASREVSYDRYMAARRMLLENISKNVGSPRERMERMIGESRIDSFQSGVEVARDIKRILGEMNLERKHVVAMWHPSDTDNPLILVLEEASNGKISIYAEHLD